MEPVVRMRWEVACHLTYATSGGTMRRATGYEKHPERLKLINHATGHRPPRTATSEGYRFPDTYLKPSDKTDEKWIMSQKSKLGCCDTDGGGEGSRTPVRNRINQTSTRVVCL